MAKYVTKYIKDHYDVIKIRKDVSERLKEFAKNSGLSISDAISYLLTNMKNNDANIIEQVTSEVADYVIKNYDDVRIKHIAYPGGDFYIFDDLNLSILF